MNPYEVEAEISGIGRVAADHGAMAAAADREVWESARRVLRERIYRTGRGNVRVRIEWPERVEGPVVRMPVRVTGAASRDVPAFVELFFHDVYLLFNLAVPGSFGGTVTCSGGSFRIREIAFDARLFEFAWVSASRRASFAVATLPLEEVVAWYDSLEIGTQQIATTGTAKALFHLLHLGRGTEDDAMTVVRLAQASEALLETRDARLERVFALRESMLMGMIPLLHPMQDDALDPRIEDAAFDWTDAEDLAAGLVVGTLQAQVVGRGR